MRLVLSLAATLVTTAALAQSEIPTVDLFAAITAGLVDDKTASVGDNETAWIQQTGPGAFAGNTEDTGSAFTFTVLEPSSCIFEATFVIDSDVPRAIRIDATRIGAITFEQREDVTGYTRYRVELGGEEGIVQILEVDGTAKPGPNTSVLGTSLTLEELQAKAAAFKTACPGAGA